MKRGKQNRSARRAALQNFLQILTRLALASILFFSAVEARALTTSAPTNSNEHIISAHAHELCDQSSHRDGIPASNHCAECCCCSLAGNDESEETEQTIAIIPNLIDIISIKSISSFNLSYETYAPIKSSFIYNIINARGPPKIIIL